MRGYNFAWKALWGSNPDWLCLVLDSRRKSGTQVKLQCLRTVQTVPRLCVLYPGIRLTTEEKKHGKTVVRVFEKCQLGTIQYINMATF